ncbi:MAG TPA: hypothetical protein DEA97_18155 [Bacteroidales bacterium]|nr:MAG: DNA-binding response regulator [candidate division TM6 bacterium GW2011_GWF2_33_332]OFY79210.1 MAG: hypothetical protein A2281_14700 [Bacteroidetes bacterium RIFOXYA12_FULL_38_20]HBS88488.1 hypothetical protein [Bacteroidales bacterium]
MDRIEFLKENLTDESIKFYRYLKESKNSDIGEICEEMANKFPELQMHLYGDLKVIEGLALSLAVIEKSSENKRKHFWVGKTIMVIDNDLNSRKFAQKLFTKDYCKLLFAENQSDVINYLYSNKVDLIIMEVLITEVDGFELIKTLKKMNRDIPVIVHSSCNQKNQQDQCFYNGCDDFISKDSSKKEFLEVVDFWAE